MRKPFLFVLAVCTFFLAGCLETTQEVTINADGSGTVSNTTDMSAAIGMIKKMETDPRKLEELNIDSTINMKEGADSIPGLTAEEKKLMSTGTFIVKSNVEKEQFILRIAFPFQSLSHVEACNQLSGKVVSQVMKDLPGKEDATGSDPAVKEGAIDDYYTTTYSKDEITRKLNKEKYADVANAESMKSMREAGTMGLEIKANYIFNLPRPAQKVEGKNVKLSADKKKVTVSSTVEEFFADGSALEFKIKY